MFPFKKCPWFLEEMSKMIDSRIPTSRNSGIDFQAKVIQISSKCKSNNTENGLGLSSAKLRLNWDKIGYIKTYYFNLIIKIYEMLMVCLICLNG